MHVITGLATLVQACIDTEDSETGNLLLSHCTAVFRSMWKSREQLRQVLSSSRHLNENEHGRMVLRLASFYAQLHEQM